MENQPVIVISLLVMEICLSGVLHAQHNAGADFHEAQSTLGLNPDKTHPIARRHRPVTGNEPHDIKNKLAKKELTSRANKITAALKLPCTLKDVDLVGLSTGHEEDCHQVHNQ